jgi:imidazole glycerol-phosphate synthase subunit HisH
MVTVAIVDYQMGNLRSVAKAVETMGGETIVSGQASELQRASHLILPGVGAFGDAIRELRNRNLVAWIQDWIAQDKPFFGICLGMQMLFEASDEGGRHEGLSVLKGHVTRFDNKELQSSREGLGDRKIPHMGWNQVQSVDRDDAMLRGISADPFFYFVHSYYCKPSDESATWLTCEYGQKFCAAVRRGKMFATQFHPEKSQGNGLKLLKNFLETHVGHVRRT